MDRPDDIVNRELQGISRRELLRRGALGGVGLAGLGTLSGISALAGNIMTASASDAEATRRMSQLIAAAKKEGGLNVIALPPDWSNYGEIISTFQKRYVSISSAAPDDSSAQEIASLQQLKGQSRAPDVVDVSPSFAAKGKAAGLFANYKVATWNTIPANMKDPHGAWYGDYWGVIAFGTNLNVVKRAPQAWEDLKSPTLRSKVALDGDPRTAGDAFGAVLGAALANGGSLDNVEPGINFFVHLKKIGNFINAAAHTAQIAKGTTPVAIKWDYLNLALVKEFKGNPRFKVTIPRHGIYGSFYCQAISSSAPHPNAARLWQEFLYSDEGQLLFLKGYAHPARYKDLVKRGKVPASLAAQLPAPSHYKTVHFATQKQLDAATKVIAEQWGPKVAGS